MTALPSERGFQDAVIEAARLFGWMVMHTRPARTRKGWVTPITGDPGFPDLVLAKGGFVIFAELKSRTGRMSADQEEWIKALTVQEEGADHIAVVWRPEDWDRILVTLKLRRVRRDDVTG